MLISPKKFSKKCMAASWENSRIITSWESKVYYVLLPDNPCRRTLSEIRRDLGTGSLDIVSAQLNLIFALLFVTKCPVSTLINKDIVA